ncbi:hypothetical protein [Lentibacillus juripiscarius]|uniref:Lipoprotein n=1 Tax=Lentibacillus juripiscarius TaxID=257446 RepID=A0ABW5VAL3_9BACI
MKLYSVISMVILLLLGAGCTNANNQVATITANPNSTYETTFKDLGIGVLYDFNFYLPDADKRWVRMWVERYRDGQKDPQPLTQISYGLSPKKVKEGHLGFGIINPDNEHSSIFLYAPGVSQKPKKIKQSINTNLPRSGGYAIGDGKVELELGKTNILAVYRRASEKGSIKLYDFQKENELEQMIKNDKTVLLLKLKTEKREEVSG